MSLIEEDIISHILVLVLRHSIEEVIIIIIKIDNRGSGSTRFDQRGVKIYVIK